MDKPSIIFFGTGPVAAKSLELLINDFDVEAVVTKPKPEGHRGSFPVLDVCHEHDLQIKIVSDKADVSALTASDPFTSEVAVLIDFGIIIKQDAIDYFPKGIVNSHFSLLPEWRGADPISFAILSGQEQTGVSLMLLSAGMDEGPLLAQTPYDISPKETMPELTDALIELSAKSLKQIIPLWLAGTTRAMPQEEVTMADPTPTYSRKLTKEDGKIDWTKPAVQLEREVRAYLEWPKSYTNLAGIDVIITMVSVVDENGETGEITDKNKRLVIACGEQSLRVEMLKPAGKQEMTAQAFLAGYGKNL